MRFLRASGVASSWAAVFGLLFVLGSLVQSVAARLFGRDTTPNASSTPEIMTITVTGGIQWTCSGASAAVLRAVSSERSKPTMDGLLGAPSSTRPVHIRSFVVTKERGEPLLQTPLALGALATVVLQI